MTSMPDMYRIYWTYPASGIYITCLVVWFLEFILIIFAQFICNFSEYFQVVDARAGPGTKSIMKMKSRNKEERKFKKKHKHKKRIPPPKPPCSPGGLSDDILSMYTQSGYSKCSLIYFNQGIWPSGGTHVWGCFTSQMDLYDASWNSFESDCEWVMGFTNPPRVNQHQTLPLQYFLQCNCLKNVTLPGILNF